MKIKLLAIAMIMFSSCVFAAKQNNGSPSSLGGGVSNIENQTKIFENTTLGKERAEWSKGRVIEKGQSVECQIDNLMRGGIKNC
ncbi:hypothetical protein [Enterobacter phage N5822]|nr:hypothetical protein [Enterobacter phage N5822]QPD96273.1 hypothetical protein [Enterobacter phage N5822]